MWYIYLYLTTRILTLISVYLIYYLSKSEVGEFNGVVAMRPNDMISRVGIVFSSLLIPYITVNFIDLANVTGRNKRLIEPVGRIILPFVIIISIDRFIWANALMLYFQGMIIVNTNSRWMRLNRSLLYAIYFVLTMTYIFVYGMGNISFVSFEVAIQIIELIYFATFLFDRKETSMSSTLIRVQIE